MITPSAVRKLFVLARARDAARAAHVLEGREHGVGRDGVEEADALGGVPAQRQELQLVRVGGGGAREQANHGREKRRARASNVEPCRHAAR